MKLKTFRLTDLVVVFVWLFSEESGVLAGYPTPNFTSTGAYSTDHFVVPLWKSPRSYLPSTICL
jgi:hypothetical protein